MTVVRDSGVPRPLDVYITIDTEVWPKVGRLTEASFSAYMAEDVYGVTKEGSFGIGFQMDVLESCGLRGVFFVESLFASAVGGTHLETIVSSIQERGHEVQLHVHPEWLRLGADVGLPDKSGQFMKDFSLDDQSLLIDVGLKNLRAAGARSICAFRAGNFAANLDTLSALGRHGIPYDSSYNVWYLNSVCQLKTDTLLLQPTRLNGVEEIPISFFRDWPGHYRHVQLSACSNAEMEAALVSAHEHGWESFVVVSHSFEMLKGRHARRRRVYPDTLVVERFRALCRFLGENRSRFRTAVFSERKPPAHAFDPLSNGGPLTSTMARTGRRYFEQLSRRFM